MEVSEIAGRVPTAVGTHLQVTKLPLFPQFQHLTSTFGRISYSNGPMIRQAAQQLGLASEAFVILGNGDLADLDLSNLPFQPQPGPGEDFFTKLRSHCMVGKDAETIFVDLPSSSYPRLVEEMKRSFMAQPPPFKKIIYCHMALDGSNRSNLLDLNTNVFFNSYNYNQLQSLLCTPP